MSTDRTSVPPSPSDPSGDRVHAYLSGRAVTLDAGSADVAALRRRVAQRRRTRRAAGSVCAVGVLGLGSVAVFGRDGGESVSVGGAGSSAAAGVSGSTAPTSASGPDAPASASPLRWATVDVPAGLGWSTSEVATSDGSLFSLSTAPGSLGPDDEVGPPVLYRSTDGQSWGPTALPTGLQASGLATSGSSLYAVGTTAAGGRVDVVIARSDDGAASWTSATIPDPLADLRGAPNVEMALGAPRVAVAADGSMLAAVSATAYPEIEDLLAANGIDATNGFALRADGVGIHGPPDAAALAACEAEFGSGTPSGSTPGTTGPGGAGVDPNAPTATAPPESTTTVGPTTTSVARTPDAPADATGPTTYGDMEAYEMAKTCGAITGPVIGSRTWTQLGVDPQVQALFGGRSWLYAAPPGGSFAPVDFPQGADHTVAALVSTPSGYLGLLQDESSTLTPVASSDGRTWTTAGADLPKGWVMTRGELGGAPAVVVSGDTPAVLVATSSGWRTIGLAGALGESSPNQDAVAMGPLGLAVLSATYRTDGPGLQSLRVHTSSDGAAFGTLDVTTLTSVVGWNVAGVSVNADAVVVRLVASGEPGSSVTAQRLLVGTPA